MTNLFQFVLLANHINIIWNENMFKHQDLQMFGLKLNQVGENLNNLI